MKLFKTRKQNCPVCGAYLTAASNALTDDCPEPGDITICIICRTILAFDIAMDLRLATDEEKNAVAAELAQTEKVIAKRYSITTTPQGDCILCHQCGNTSYNLNDIEKGYCGHCHAFLGD